MVQCGSSAGFALKSAERLFIIGDFFGKKLERDGTMQACVFGFVDHAHPAAADPFFDAVMGDDTACFEAGVYGAGWIGEILKAAYGGSFEVASGIFMGVHQGPYFPFEFMVLAAGVAQECGAFLFGQLDGRLKQIVDLLPAFRIHGQASQSTHDTTTLWRCSSPALP